MNSKLRDEDLILIGKVVGVHGVRGKVKVFPYTESPDTIKPLKAVWLRDKTSGLRKFLLESVSIRKSTVILGLSGLNSRTEAESLVNADVYYPKQWLERLSAGEYYWYQIIGLTVELENGPELGKIKAIFRTGSNDVYVVENGPKEYLIPAIEDVVVDIDLSSKVMTIRPLEGLLDMNDI